MFTNDGLDKELKGFLYFHGTTDCPSEKKKRKTLEMTWSNSVNLQMRILTPRDFN